MERVSVRDAARPPLQLHSTNTTNSAHTHSGLAPPLSACRPPAQAAAPREGRTQGRPRAQADWCIPSVSERKANEDVHAGAGMTHLGKAGMSWALPAGYLCAVCQGDSSGDPSCLRSTCTPHVFPGLKRTFLIPIVIFLAYRCARASSPCRSPHPVAPLTADLRRSFAEKHCFHVPYPSHEAQRPSIPSPRARATPNLSQVDSSTGARQAINLT